MPAGARLRQRPRQQQAACEHGRSQQTTIVHRQLSLSPVYLVVVIWTARGLRQGCSSIHALAKT
jgi:hypothetical protein